MALDDDEMSDDDQPAEENKTEELKPSDVIQGDGDAIQVIQKAKAEDDEYKTDDGEKNYYSIAHTIHEKITQQATILVNGNLKGYLFTYFIYSTIYY